MQVREVMTTDVAVCEPVTNAARAAETMWTHDWGILPVLEEGGHLVGIVTDRDLFIALGTQDRRASEVPVYQVMHRQPAACMPGDDVRNALRIMAEHHIHRLPVVEDSGSLKGMLSINDVIARATPGSNGTFTEDIIRTLRATCERRRRTLDSHLSEIAR